MELQPFCYANQTLAAPSMGVYSSSSLVDSVAAVAANIPACEKLWGSIQEYLSGGYVTDCPSNQECLLGFKHTLTYNPQTETSGCQITLNSQDSGALASFMRTQSGDEYQVLMPEDGFVAVKTDYKNQFYVLGGPQGEENYLKLDKQDKGYNVEFSLGDSRFSASCGEDGTAAACRFLGKHDFRSYEAEARLTDKEAGLNLKSEENSHDIQLKWDSKANRVSMAYETEGLKASADCEHAELGIWDLHNLDLRKYQDLRCSGRYERYLGSFLPNETGSLTASVISQTSVDGLEGLQFVVKAKPNWSPFEFEVARYDLQANPQNEFISLDFSLRNGIKTIYQQKMKCNGFDKNIDCTFEMKSERESITGNAKKTPLEGSIEMSSTRKSYWSDRDISEQVSGRYAFDPVRQAVNADFELVDSERPVASYAFQGGVRPYQIDQENKVAKFETEAGFVDRVHEVALNGEIVCEAPFGGSEKGYQSCTATLDTPELKGTFSGRIQEK